MHDLFGFNAEQDPRLLIFAFGLTLVSSFAVFKVRSRMRRATRELKIAWIFLCACEGGAGGGAAQFVALLAYHPKFATAYEPIGALGVVVIAVPLIAVGLLVSWLERDRWRTIAGGFLIALGLASARFATLHAYGVAARIVWEPATLWCAVMLGAALAAAALEVGGNGRTLKRQMLGALLLASAVTTMHVLGMRAMTLVPDATVRIATASVPGGVIAVPIVLAALLMIIVGVVVAIIDEATSLSSARRLRRLADVSREGIVALWADGRIADCNAAFVALVQQPMDALIGAALVGRLLLLDEPTLRVGRTVEGVLVADDGEHVPVEVVSRPMVEAGEESLPPTVVLLRDLREQQAAEKRIRYLAEHDLQTGLPNRPALLNFLRHAHARHLRDRMTIMVCILGVRNYKEINELYGMEAGDALLAKTADRLKRFAGVTGHAARIGSAEFAFVGFGSEPTAPREVEWQIGIDVVERLSAILRRPFDHNGVRLEPKVSCGAAGLPHDAGDTEELLAHAESALDRARTLGGSDICLFQAEIHDALRRQRKLADELRTAISEDQLVLFYQPQADTRSCEITGFEALVRWRHPSRGLLPPDQFIGVAESEGLISSLGEWVLRRACLDAASWKSSLSVAVNLSPLQIGVNSLSKRVHEILIETQMSPGRLELEVTESALLGDQQHALDVLRRLKALGLRITMDDFGTGYSSLSSLHSFPFDKIKIDKSFVAGIGKLERSTVLVRAVLGIGRGLGIPVVAEGVETAEQLAFLRAEACASIQGYHIGKPAPVQTYAALTGGGDGVACTAMAWSHDARGAAQTLK